jgi:hypothetical protein
MRLAAAAAALAPEPLNPELRANAMEAWGNLKTDLWSHIEREDALIFSCGASGLSAEFIEPIRREEGEIRELVKRIEDNRATDDRELALTQALALAAMALVLDAHIERGESVFHAIRQAAARPRIAPVKPPSTSSHLISVLQGPATPRPRTVI